jgi:hypothetical protein
MPIELDLPTEFDTPTESDLPTEPALPTEPDMPTEVEELCLSLAPADNPESDDDRDSGYAHGSACPVRGRADGAKTV